MNKDCKQCGVKFELFEEDLKFYKKVAPVIDGKKREIPSPAFCPDCRQQRRMAFRNERNLYKGECDLCGDQMVSLYSSKKEFPIYCKKCWWSDKWDPMDYAQDFDFSRPFMEQMFELRNKVPRVALYTDMKSENSEYTNHGSGNKNLYLGFLSVECVDCSYMDHCYQCKDCIDCFRLDYSELCSECSSCQTCWNLHFSHNSNNCRDSLFLDSCKNCSNCIGCVNLRNKEYCFLNEKVSKEEFEELKRKFEDSEYLAKFMEKFEVFRSANLIRSENNNSNCENVVECDYLQNSKNCYRSFDLINVQDARYTSLAGYLTDACDVYSGGFANLLYECVGVGDIGGSSSNIYFSFFVLAPYNVYYCDVIHQCENVFGCVGLKRKKNCIFNKQYSKEEYEKLTGRIVEHMQKTGEWGEYFPITYSPFSYNDTAAYLYHPLSRDEALERGWGWTDPEQKEIRKDLLGCSECGKNYKVIPQETKLLWRLKLPDPVCCPNCRFMKRFNTRNSRKIWDRECGKCSGTMKTTCSPERPEEVYCEKCYLKEIC